MSAKQKNLLMVAAISAVVSAAVVWASNNVDAVKDVLK